MAKPTEFKNRGVFVGFETSGLSNLRCRPSKTPDEPGYEALVSNWSGEESGRSTGDLIMPFSTVPEWVNLSDRDMALHASVTQYGYQSEGYIDPQAIRQIRFETDMAFADSMLRMRAVEELRIESLDSQNTYFEILSIFSRKYGATINNRELKFVSRPILQQLARENPEDVLRLTREITKAAAQYGEVSPAVLSARLDFFAAFAAPICSLLNDKTYDRDVGYLSRQLGALEELLDALEDYREETNSETDSYITEIQDNADQFIDFAKAQANNILLLIVDDRSYTRDEQFKILKEELFENRMHIAYALDGWEQHFIKWKKIFGANSDTKDEFIAKLYKLMPQATLEIKTTARDYNVVGVGSRAGAIRMMHNWDDEHEDKDLINRVKAGRLDKSAMAIVNAEHETNRRKYRSR